MTVPPHQPAPAAARHGFTLVELLVVIGILALLAAVLLPAINSVRRSAFRTAEASALQSIATALDQYQSDQGDYPRLDESTLTTTPGSLADEPALNYNGERGARLLARALFGPAPKTQPSVETPPVVINDLLRAFQDGHEATAADTFGFKPSRQVVPDGSGGQTWYLPGKPSGPYLDGGRWNLRKAAGGFDASVVILDRNDEPYLYYPRRSGTVANSETYSNVTFDGASRASGSLVSVNGPTLSNIRQQGLYNAFDNHNHLPAALSGTNVDDDGDGIPDETGLLNYLLGDTNLDGAIGPGETQAYDGPYLLIASDDNNNYGVDSVVNFTPQPTP